jgi:hypothetical protein
MNKPNIWLDRALVAGLLLLVVIGATGYVVATFPGRLYRAARGLWRLE